MLHHVLQVYQLHHGRQLWKRRWRNLRLEHPEIEHEGISLEGRPVIQSDFHQLGDYALCHEFLEWTAKDLIYCLRRRVIDILRNIGTIHECGICRFQSAYLKEVILDNTIPIALVKLLVAIISTFFWYFNRSICVSRAFTTWRTFSINLQKSRFIMTYTKSVAGFIAGDGTRTSRGEWFDFIYWSRDEQENSVQQNQHSPISRTMNSSSSLVISPTVENKFWTSFPDSENHLENSEWELISNRCVLA